MKRANNLLSKKTISVRFHVGDELLLREYCRRHNVPPSTAVRYIVHQYFELNEHLADRRREARRYDKLLEAARDENATLPTAEELCALAEPEASSEQSKQLLQEIAAEIATKVTTALGTELAEKVANHVTERLTAVSEATEAKLIEALTVEFGDPLNRLVEMLFKYFDESAHAAHERVEAHEIKNPESVA